MVGWLARLGRMKKTFLLWLMERYRKEMGIFKKTGYPVSRGGNGYVQSFTYMIYYYPEFPSARSELTPPLCTWQAPDE